MSDDSYINKLVGLMTIHILLKHDTDSFFDSPYFWYLVPIFRIKFLI